MFNSCRGDVLQHIDSDLFAAFAAVSLGGVSKFRLISSGIHCRLYIHEWLSSASKQKGAGEHELDTAHMHKRNCADRGMPWLVSWLGSLLTEPSASSFVL